VIRVLDRLAQDRGVVAITLGLLLGLAVTQQPVLVPLAVVGAAVALGCVAWPPAMIGLIFVSILFDKLGVTGVDVARFPITASKLAVLGSLGLWTVHVLLTRTRLLRWHPVLSAMLACVASTGVTLAIAGSMKHGRFALIGLAMMTVMVALVYAVLAERALQTFFRLLGLAWTAALAASLAGGRGGAGEAARATGTFGDANEWATMVLLITPLILGALVDDEHPAVRPLRMAIIGLAPLAVLLTGSRSALVAGLLVGPGILWLLWSRRGELAACAGAGLLAAPFLANLDTAIVRFRALLDTLSGRAVVRDSSLSERSELFRQAQDLFLDNWLVGAGPGNFERASGFISVDGRFRPAHNTYLEIASEQGLVGLVPMVIFIGMVGLTLYRGYQHAHSLRARHRVVGGALSVVAVALMAATLGLLTFSMAYLVLGVSLALAYQAQDPRVPAS